MNLTGVTYSPTENASPTPSNCLQIPGEAEPGETFLLSDSMWTGPLLRKVILATKNLRVQQPHQAKEQCYTCSYTLSGPSSGIFPEPWRGNNSVSIVLILSLSQVSIALRKRHDQKQLLEGRVYFGLHFHIIICHWEKGRTGAWRQELMQRSDAYWLARSAFLQHSVPPAQRWHLLGSLTWLINAENTPQACPQAGPVMSFYHLRFLLPKYAWLMSS